MTSIFKTPHGEMQQFVQNLHTGGFTYEDVVRIIKEPNLAIKMCALLRPRSAFMAAFSTRERVNFQLSIWQMHGVRIDSELEDTILRQADAFELFTATDEPLVTGGFGYDNPTVVANRLFAAFVPTIGYSKVNYLEQDKAELRYVSGMEPSGGLRLVHFDPNAYPGLSPEAAVKAAKRDKVRLAGIEVLEHLMLEPTSGYTWDGKLYFYPNLSGLRRIDTDGSFVPCLARWSGESRFALGPRHAAFVVDEWASPVVREC